MIAILVHVLFMRVTNLILHQVAVIEPLEKIQLKIAAVVMVEVRIHHCSNPMLQYRTA